jgi:hypothetical protein
MMAVTTRTLFTCIRTLAMVAAAGALATGSRSHAHAAAPPGACTDSVVVAAYLAERLPLEVPGIDDVRVGRFTWRPGGGGGSLPAYPDTVVWPPANIEPTSPAVFWAPDSVAYAFLNCCTGAVDDNIHVFSAIDSVWGLNHGGYGPSVDVLDIEWCDARTLIVVVRDTFDDGLGVSVLDLRELRTGWARVTVSGTLPSQSPLYDRVWAYNRETGKLPPPPRRRRP